MDLSRETHNVGRNRETNLTQSHRICSNNVSFINLKRSGTLIMFILLEFLRIMIMNTYYFILYYESLNVCYAWK
jgi:hypothetical protein